jgi:hypothetical protein
MEENKYTRINLSLYNGCKIGCDDCGVTFTNEIKNKYPNINIEEILSEIDKNKNKIILQFYKDGDPVEINISEFNEMINIIARIEKVEKIYFSSVLCSFAKKSEEWLQGLKVYTNSNKLHWTISLAEIKGKAKINKEVILKNVEKLKKNGVAVDLRTFRHRSGYPSQCDEKKLQTIAEEAGIELVIIENNIYKINNFKTNIEFYSDCGVQ